MNNTSKILAAGLLAVATLGGTAFADNENSAFAQSVREHTYGNASSDFGYPSAQGFVTRAAKLNAVSVRPVDALPKAERSMVLSSADADPAAVQALQASIRGNENLVRALGDQQVKVSDVISTSHALDGSTTYIVR